MVCLSLIPSAAENLLTHLGGREKLLSDFHTPPRRDNKPAPPPSPLSKHTPSPNKWWPASSIHPYKRPSSVIINWTTFGSSCPAFKQNPAVAAFCFQKHLFCKTKQGKEDKMHTVVQSSHETEYLSL